MAVIDAVVTPRLPPDVCEDFFAGFCPNEKCTLRHVDNDSILDYHSPPQPPFSDPSSPPTQPQPAAAPDTQPNVVTDGPPRPDETPPVPVSDEASMHAEETAMKPASSANMAEKEHPPSQKSTVCKEFLTMGFCMAGEDCAFRHPNPDDQDIDLEDVGNVYEEVDEDEDENVVTSNGRGKEGTTAVSKLDSGPKGPDAALQNHRTVSAASNLQHIDDVDELPSEPDQQQHFDDVDELPSEPDEPATAVAQAPAVPNGSHSSSPSTTPKPAQSPALGKRASEIGGPGATDIASKRARLDTPPPVAADAHATTSTPPAHEPIVENDQIGTSMANPPISDRTTADNGEQRNAGVDEENGHPPRNGDTSGRRNSWRRGQRSSRRGRKRQTPNVGETGGLVIPKAQHDAHIRDTYYCEICNQDCNSADNFKSHKAGRKHRREVAKRSVESHNVMITDMYRKTEKPPVNPPIDIGIQVDAPQQEEPPQDDRGAAPTDRGPDAPQGDGEGSQADSPRSVADPVENQTGPPGEQPADDRAPPANVTPPGTSNTPPADTGVEPSRKESPSATTSVAQPPKEKPKVVDDLDDDDDDDDAEELPTMHAEFPDLMDEPGTEETPVDDAAAVPNESNAMFDVENTETPAPQPQTLPTEEGPEPMRDVGDDERVPMNVEEREEEATKSKPTETTPPTSQTGPVIESGLDAELPTSPVEKEAEPQTDEVPQPEPEPMETTELEQGEISHVDPRLSADFENMVTISPRNSVVEPSGEPDRVLEDGEMPDVTLDIAAVHTPETDRFDIDISETKPTIAWMNALYDYARNRGPVSNLAFKILIELLVSPNIGVGLNHLAPLMRAMRDVNMYIDARQKPDIIYSYWAQYHPQLVGVSLDPESELHYERILDAPARDAVQLVGDNLTYLMYKEKADEKDDTFMKQPMQPIPMRGRFPLQQDPSGRQEVQTHGDFDVSKDDFWMQVQAWQAQAHARENDAHM